MKKLLTICAAVALVLALSGLAQADTRYVGPGEIYTTIQAAIDDASPGDTIYVAPGTYGENVIIAKSLDLIGAGSTTTTIDGNNVENTVTITASNVKLAGFRVTGGWQDGGNGVFYPDGGVVVDGNGGASALTGITIEDNIIDGNSGNGVYISAAGHGGAASNVVIKDCEIFNNGGSKNYAGISLTHPNYILRPVGVWDEWRRPKNILVQGNTIHSNSNYGLYVSAGENNVIRSNEIWGNSKYGLQLASSWNRTDIPCEYTTVEDNEIYDNTRNGVKLTSWNQYNTFTRNNIYNNGNGGSSPRYKYGFLFQDGNDNTIQNNTITANALGGLYLWGNGDPSYTWYSTTDNIITANIISNHTAAGGHGIYIPAQSGYPNSGFLNSHINCNLITNNFVYGLENADATQIVHAENNWWGDASGPYHATTNPDGTGGAVSDDVDFDPWLDDVVSDPCVALFECFDIDDMKIKLHHDTDDYDMEKIEIKKAQLKVEEIPDLSSPVVLTVEDYTPVNLLLSDFEDKKGDGKFEYKSERGEEPKIDVKLEFDKCKWTAKIDKIDDPEAVVDNTDGVSVSLTIGGLMGDFNEVFEEKEHEFKFKRDKEERITCCPKPTPPGAAFTGGAFWAGTTTGAYAYSWVATYPVYYPNEKEGVNPSTAQGEFGNTYGPNIRDFEIDGALVSTVTLKGTVTLKNIGPWPETSYFEVGLGGSLNSWFQFYQPSNPEGSVYVIFQGNSEGGHDIFIQDYSGQSPPSGAVYSTTGTPGDDPVQKDTFHFLAEFDLVNRLAYLTVDGVSLPSVAFGKSILAMSGMDIDEHFDVPIGVFAGMISTDTDNTGRATMSALKVTVEYQ